MNRKSLAESAKSLKLCFDSYDEDRDGRLSIDQTKAAVRALNKMISESDLNSVIKRVTASFEPDAVPTLDYYAFAAIASGKGINCSLPEIRSAFTGLCRGEMASAENLKFLLTTMGEELTNEQVELVFTACDVAPGGSVSVNDVIEKIRSSHLALNGEALTDDRLITGIEKC